MSRPVDPMGRRRPFRFAQFLSMLTVVIAVAMITVYVVAATRDGEPAGPGAAASPSGSAWPVQIQEPEPVVVPGDGTFTDPTAVDRTDPDAVAAAAAELFASHDTLTDTTVTDAADRAAPLLAPALQGVAEPERSTVGPDWLAAQQHEAYTVPAVSVEPIPSLPDDPARVGQPAEGPNGPVLAYEFRVVYNWQGRDGWTSDPQSQQVRVVQLSLAERNGEWVVVERFYGDPEIAEYDHE